MHMAGELEAGTTAATFAVHDHSQCEILSRRSRGKLCEELARRPARRLAPGEFVYHMGDAALSVYLIRQGRVKTAVVSQGGQELTLRIHQPGDVFGELCICSGERREEAIALEASEVVAITLEMLMARMRQDPLIALDLTSIACEHLAVAYNRLQSLSADATIHRLARTLLDLAAETGDPASDGTIVLPYLAQEELAHLIGARREVASTLLNQLRVQGLVSYTRRGPITIDVSAVRAFLGTVGLA